MRRTARAGAAAAALLAASAALAGAPAAARAASCASDAAPVSGGEWRTYGGDLTGARHQDAPDQAIGVENADRLEPQWTFTTSGAGASGVFQSTPTVADGCVYLGTSTGWLLAMNADSGEVVWRTKVEIGQPGLLGAGAVGAPTVSGGRAYFLVSEAGEGPGSGRGPFVVALDSATGEVLWRTVVEETRFAYADASPVLHEGILFAGFNGDESYWDSRGGFALLDAGTGEILRRTYTTDDESTPEDEYAQGAAGGSVWATAVVDAERDYAYVGTANPTGDVESPNTNAIVKVDLDRTRPTFGQIVDRVKGTPDSVSPVNPLCGRLRNPMDPNGDGGLSVHSVVGCSRADFDFGASPNMLEIDGRLAVAELQKSGYVHAAYVDGPRMEPAWSALTGPAFFFDNLATSATDGERVYVTAGPPGQIWALDADSGRPVWVAPIGDQLHYQSVTVANGVVYTIDSLGWLWGYSAETGEPLLHRELREDTGGNSSGFANPSSVGVAAARNSLYVADGDFIVRYRATGTGAGSGVPDPPGLPDIPPPPESAIVAGPGAFGLNYATPEAVVTEGGDVTFANADALPHDVIAVDRGPGGAPLFASELVGIGRAVPVEGVEALPIGDYGFFCSLHGRMRGTLRVVERPAGMPAPSRWRSLTDAFGAVVER